MKVGGLYNFVYQNEKLVYLGKKGCWNQFARVQYPEIVWAEILDSDLSMIEKAKLEDI